MTARILAGLVALMMSISAFGWLVNPADAAAGLGMPYLEGLARSTQVGDFSAFFVGVTVFCIVGIVYQSSTWVRAAAIILALAALFRTAAWAVHGAELATLFIAVELVMAILLVVSAVLMDRQSKSEQQ